MILEVEVEVKCRAQKRIVTVSEMNLGSKISLVVRTHDGGLVRSVVTSTRVSVSTFTV